MKQINEVWIPQENESTDKTPVGEENFVSVVEQETKYKQQKVNKSVKTTSGEAIDQDLEAESNRNYYKTVSEIVGIAKDHLKHQNKEKTGIRDKLIVFFIVLLSLQIVAVVVFITLTACGEINFAITDYLLTVFITSVFVETLGAITIMIVFAFGSKEEVEVVGLLTTTIKNYQKFRRNIHGELIHKDDETTDNQD